jgi:hypothetical protein
LHSVRAGVFFSDNADSIDSGFFAQGSYFTFDADYAWHVYGSLYLEKLAAELSKNTDKKREKSLIFELSPVLIVAKVVTGHVYPANRRLQARGLTRTISDSIGRANIPGYDSHFSLVKHAGGCNFEPIVSLDDFERGEVFTEIVTFDVGQVLPLAILRPLVEPEMELL